MIRNNNFIEIKNYTILNKDVFIQKDHINYHFQLPEKINDININSFASKIIAIKLKVKETDLITSFEYEFLDLFNNKIKVDSDYKFSDDFFENDRIYLFNGFYYNNKTLYATNFSSIEMIDQNSISDNNYFPKDIDRIKIGKIVNLEGLIIDLNIVEFSVFIEELNSHEKVKLKLNYELIKKINPNRKCQFISVKKIDDKIFELTQLTDIYANFDTTIGLKIYDIQDKYYNRININNSYIDIVDENINENMLKFNIDAKDKSVLFEQKFIFEKVRKINDKKCDKDNFVIEDSYEFTLEVNNGRMNKYPCFLKKNGGFTYQLHFQTKESSLLPEKIKIKLGDNNFTEIDDFESFDNKLKKRITIINAVKQDFIDINYKYRPFRLNENEFIDTEINKNLKIYYIIKDKEENKIFEKAFINKNNNRVFMFDLSGNMHNKEYLRIKTEDKKEIKYVFQNILNGKNEQSNVLKDKIRRLLEENNYKDYLEKGLMKYIFHNSKEEYDIIKQLLILFFLVKCPRKLLIFILLILKIHFLF